MRVSFVVPTRNQATFLATCVESCLAQQLPDAEIIVIDGASTDGTRSLLEGYGDRIRWISEPDRGQSDAVNKGVGLARGEVIAWLNSDDFYPHPQVLPRVVEIFAAEPEVDVVFGDGQMVDTRGRPLRDYPVRPLQTSAEIVAASPSPFLQPALFFRKRLFDAVGGLDESLHFTLDYELWIRMWRHARRVRYLPERLACATSHDGAKSIKAMRAQIFEALQVKRRYSSELGLGPRARLRMYRGVAGMYAYLVAVRLHLKRAV